jgi:hypothetical protein
MGSGRAYDNGVGDTAQGVEQVCGVRRGHFSLFCHGDLISEGGGLPRKG